MNPLPSARLLRLFALLLVVSQMAAFTVQVVRARHAALNTAADVVDRVSLSVEAVMNRSLVQVDAALVGLPLLLAPLANRAPPDLDAINEVLRQINSQNFTYRDLLIAASDGPPIAAALPGSRRRPLILPLGTRYGPAGAGPSGLAIGGPQLNPSTGEPSLFFARPVTMPPFGEVHAVAEVPLSALNSLLTSGGELRGLRVLATREDGTLLGVVPGAPIALGQRLAPNIAPGIATGRSTASRIDSRAVIAAARPTLYPGITITAELDEEAALAGWYDDRNAAIALSAALTILLAALAGILLFWLTRRDAMERERQRWRQMLETALESMSDGFVMFDENDRLIICNESYRRMYSLSAPFIHEGAQFEDIVREGARRGQYPQIEGDVEAFIRDLQRHRLSGGVNIERLLPDGTWILITERMMPGGGTVGIRTNITTLKRAMEELSAARDAAQTASAARGMFLARMSHELRTPLNAVLGFAQILMLDHRIDGTARGHLRLMSEAAAHLRDVVNTLLDLSKAEAGKLEIQPRPIALRRLAETCMGLMSVEVERCGLTLALEIEPGLPEAVLADAMRLRQVLLNLLANAVKASPPGGRVILRLRRTAAPGLRFEVEDDGPGVPLHERGKLFRDFSQLNLQPGADLTGTGLGLAISARIAAAMGGRIGVEDGTTPGALFWMELPLPEAVLPEVAPAPSAPSAETPLHLLVVDDIAVNRTLARAMLEQVGHRVDLAGDGEEALAAVQASAYDAVLMDVQMPVMDGLEATRRIRRLPGAVRDTPIIALSASAMRDQIEACRLAGMDGHLAKPINRVELLAMVHDIQKARSAAPAPG